MLAHPKDKTPLENQYGTIYHITCNDDAQHTYLGESLGLRFKEHTKLDKPTVDKHCLNTGHSVSITNTKALERELDWHRGQVNKTIHLRQ